LEKFTTKRLSAPLSVGAAALAAFALAACGVPRGNTDKTSSGSRGGFAEALRVYNATEYMDKSVVADFEKEFHIQVIYGEFESNEEMYDEIVKNPDAYDVLIPSDYTIDRLIQEGRLAKITPDKIPNIARVAPQYLKPGYDPNNEYVVPYMAGTLGILYNKKMTAAPVDSWAALWDSGHKGPVLLWDSQRDVIGAALKALGFGMNAAGDAELAQAKARLSAGGSRFQYGSDEIRDRMVADEGALALVYSGDAKTAVDENPDLSYVVPKEGSNKWVDGFVILKNTRRLEEAEKFIDFMCRPNVAVRNMTKTGYTSPVSGAWAEFGGNRIMFPTEEELDRCEPFLYNAEAAQKYARLWAEVRGRY
jgi:spermidine/putrescine transport system substrate-binding protein